MKVESAMSASSQAKSSRNRATTHSQPAEQPASLESQVFGVPLETLVTNATAGMLPRPLRECISYIRHNGLATEGLFRRSPPSTALRAAKDSYNRGQHVDLDLAGVHVAAVLLKLFFRELPTPVFGTQNSYEIVRALPLAGKTAPQEEGDTVDAVSEQMDNVRARYVEEVVLGSLDKACRLVLCFTFALLGVVSRHEEDNRMSAYNLAIVWAPNLARSDNPVEDVSMCAGGGATVGAVVQIMVRFFDRVFVREIEEILGKQPEDAAVAILDAVDQMNTGPVAPELPKRRPIAGSAETEAFSDDGSEQPFADAETAVVEEHPLDTGDNDDDGKAAAESTSQTTKSSD
ncbi:hypothetical protein GGI25_003881 [Coemansia spiralis]|uniref:Rho-GAP domain-containing protein n=2 Tax=Coemansia TaxID=4863 RepID=A0A9W8KW31_9FUNG|nr:hypothetical protein GGI26_004379 [Coemansia sp. RSA 1358]KAJ2675683.1 hypothetical protein GGI25_003881 [Coemansia spiralis]